MVVGPLAATQRTEKFFVKARFGGPSGLVVPPGNPSIEVGGFAPPKLMDFQEEASRLDPQHRVSRETSQWSGWLPEALPRGRVGMTRRTSTGMTSRVTEHMCGDAEQSFLQE